MNEDYPEIPFHGIRPDYTVKRRSESQGLVSEYQITVHHFDGLAVVNSADRSLRDFPGCTWHLVHRPEPKVVLPQEPTRGVVRLDDGTVREGIALDGKFSFIANSGRYYHIPSGPRRIESFTPTIAVPKEEWDALMDVRHQYSPYVAVQDLIDATERLHGDAS